MIGYDGATVATMSTRLGCGSLMVHMVPLFGTAADQKPICGFTSNINMPYNATIV